MGLSTGIGLGIQFSRGGGQSWDYTTQLYDQADLNFWYKEGTRSTLTLPDTISPGTGDAKILLPSFMAVDRTESFIYNPEQLIGTTYTFYIRARLDNTAYNMLLTGTTGGASWGVWFDLTNKRWYHKAGGVTIYSANDTIPANVFTDNLWHDIVITRSDTAVNLYIDGATCGSELTLASNGVFYLRRALGDNTYSIKYVTEVKIFTTVKTPAAAKSDDPDGHWLIYTGKNVIDIITGINIPAGVAVGYDNVYLSQTEGSTYLLNRGYSLYTVKKGCSVIASDIYLPYLPNGTANTLTIPATGYVKDSDHPGSTTSHNLANTFIEFSQSGWDRSDVTLWNDKARVALAGGGYYDSTNPKRWHISELTQKTFILYGEASKKTLNHAKIKATHEWDLSAINGDGVNLREIFSYNTNKTGADLINVFLYTNETGVHAVDYYFSNTHYCATRGDKILAFDGTDTLSLSTDGGATFPTTLQIVGIADQIQFAHIFEGGNILFCTHTKAYYSTDNLATYAESSVQNSDGSPATLGTYSNFRPLTCNQFLKVGTTDIVVWGRYIATPDEYEVNGYVDKIVAWYSLDGSVVKTAWRSNATTPVKWCNHIHGISYDEVEDYFYVQTGDGVGKEHLLRGRYTVAGDTWAWTLLATSTAETRYQSTGIAFDGDYAYLGEEQYHHIITTLKSAIADKTSFEQLYYSPLNTNGFFGLSGKFTDELIWAEAGLADCIGVSIDKINFLKHYLIGGVVSNSNDSFIALKPKNNDGYYLAEVFAATETLLTVNKGQVLMIRVIKPED